MDPTSPPSPTNIANENELQALVERLSALLVEGQTLVIEDIPQHLIEQSVIQNLLRLARVNEALAGNRAAERTPIQPEQIGQWRIKRLLGQGGMGEVWLGERLDASIEHLVAIKCVHSPHPRFVDRLIRERQILAKLNHPNVAGFLDAGLDAKGLPWLAMEYVDGISLTDWCEQQQLSLEARLRLFLKVCAAVSHAHRHLIVHRDIKPNNILVDALGEPKLLDFGISKLLVSESDETTVHSLTPGFAAPEQLRGGMISTLTDVYSLGLLLYRILAGALPPTRQNPQAAAVLARLDEEETHQPSQTARSQVAQLPYAPKTLQGDLDAIVQKAIRAAPDQRYASAAAFAEDIECYLDSRPVLARAPTRRYRWARWAKRNRLAVALSSALVLALLVGSSLALWQAKRASAASAIAIAEAARAEREADSAKRELARAEQMSAFMTSLFREQDPLSRAGSISKTSKELLSDAVLRVESSMQSDPLSAAQLLRVLGESQVSLGEKAAARSTLERGKQLAMVAGDALLGAQIDALLGRLATYESRQDNADQLFASALATAEKLRGADSLEAARISSQRAISLILLARFKDARAAAVHADRVMSKQLPTNDSDRITARIMLGNVLEQLREDAEATSVLKDAIAASESAFGPNDARLVRPLQSLGEVQRRGRDFVQARALHARAVDIARQNFAARHTVLSSALVYLAAVERDAGEIPRAIEVLNAADSATPSEDDYSRAQLLTTRASTWLELKDAVRAETDFREALRLRRLGGGLKNGQAWFVQAQLGQALMAQGRLSEADALQAEASQELRKLLGPDAYQNALIDQRWALTLEARGNFSLAQERWREAIRLVEKTYGLEHPLHLDFSRRLAENLTRTIRGHAEALALSATLLKRWHNQKDAGDRVADLLALRCQLSAEPAEAMAAREFLAGETIEADAEARKLLQQCAKQAR